MEKGNSRGMAVSGISTALVILSLYGGVVIVNNKLFFMALGVSVLGIPYASSGIKMGLMSYAASAILALIILPNKIYALVFVFLGVYPLVKLVSENRKLLMEFLLKLIWFNITTTLLYFIFNNFIHLEGVFSVYPGKALLLLIANTVFMIYDFVFTKFIMFVHDRVLIKR